MWTFVNPNSYILQIYQLTSSKVYHSSIQTATTCGFFSSRKSVPTNLYKNSGERFRTFALRKSEKKVKDVRKTSKSGSQKCPNIPLKEFEDLLDNTGEGNEGGFNTLREPIRDDFCIKSSPATAARSAVLKACTITSGFLLAIGLLIRQGSHIASGDGWSILDASAEVSFDLEIWHIQLIIGIVVLISSCRYILLKIWPEFLESSEAANQQVLGSLQPLDYLVVSFFPGISEEILFRGALLPLLGLSWKSALVVGAIFGGLHLSGGRRYSFAIWASFVGFIYGMTTIASSSIIVPMASHSLNNLIGGILWRYTSSSEKKIS